MPADWEIAFIATAPWNLKEDTVAVTGETKALYQQITGSVASTGVKPELKILPLPQGEGEIFLRRTDRWVFLSQPIAGS